MSASKLTSPVTEALTRVLALCYPQQVARSSVALDRLSPADQSYLVLSYRLDFERLWNLDERSNEGLLDGSLCGTDGRPGAVTLVVVNDGLPPPADQAGDISNYVTVYDWALTYAWALSQRSESQRAAWPHLRVLILDLESERRGAFGRRMLSFITHSLPWVQIYRPRPGITGRMGVRLDAFLSIEMTNLVTSILRAALPLGFFGMEGMLLDALMPHRILSLPAAYETGSEVADLAAIRHLWRSHLARPGGRHQVANLLGPMRLASGLPEGLRQIAAQHMRAGYQLRGALEKVAVAVGLTAAPVPPAPAAEQAGLLQEAAGQADLLGRRRHISFLLVDDLYALGYQHVLGCLLLGELYEPPPTEKWEVTKAKDEFEWSLRCVSDAEALLRKLQMVKNWEQPRWLDAGADVILLDLRLWIGEARAASFLRKLVKVCADLGAARIKDPFFQEALTQARRLAGRASGNELKALALLPLLLSHYDPSLPVIIFSSTQQRAVVEMMAHRANLITDFAKPLLSGQGEESSPAEQLEDLRQALHQAIRLHETRGIWQRIERTRWGGPPVFELVGKDPSGQGEIAVYNFSGTSLPKLNDSKRRFKATASGAPRMSNDALRVRLAEHYHRYLAEARDYDFTSAPWELLEFNFVSPAVLVNPWIANPNFALDDRLSRRNSVARVLELIRNKKTHGLAHAPATEAELAAFRQATLLEWLFLLDFVEDRISPPPVGDALLERMEAYLRVKYVQLRNTKGRLGAHLLKFNPQVEWLDFVAFIACAALRDAVEGPQLHLDAATAAAVIAVGEQLLKSYDPLLDNLLRHNSASPQLALGTPGQVTVIACAQGGFWAEGKFDNESRRLLVWLPALDACPWVGLGDQFFVTVEAINGHQQIEVSEEQWRDTLLLISRRHLNPHAITSWFNPLPQQVQAARNGRGLEAVFATHEEAHQAKNSATLERGVRVEWD